MIGDGALFRAKAEEARNAAASISGATEAEELLKIAIAYDRLAEWVLAHPYPEIDVLADGGRLSKSD